MLKSIKVRDYMTRNLVTFRADTELFTAIKRLQEHRISGAPVVNKHGGLIGMLSEEDCLRALLSGAYYEAIGGTVETYMKRNVETLCPETDIISVAQRFLSGDQVRFPVIKDDRLVGLISRSDALRAMREFAQNNAINDDDDD